MRSTVILSALLSLTSYTAAWPWPENLPGHNVIHGLDEPFFKRQNSASTGPGSGSGSQQASSTQQPTRTASGSQSNTRSGSNSASITANPSSTISNSNDTSQSTEYDARLPAGGVSMITPNPIAGTQFYKVGDYVTFAWNYTSLSATPSAVNVYASCSANSQLYTLTSNMTVADKQTILWDTKAQATAQVPLLTNQYTLIIVDSGSAVTAVPKAGYLGVSNSLTFGMYVPQPYSNWTDYQCATCSGAMGLSGPAGPVLGMLFVMVASFTWFASSFGLL